MEENARIRAEAGDTEQRPLPRWLGQVPRDVLLIVLGAALAFASEELRDLQHRRTRVAATLVSIQNELRANAALVTTARARHADLVDTLGKLVAAHRFPGVELYSNGMFNPASVTNTAWQAARETGALNDIPLATVLNVAPAYEAQERYRSLADALNTAILMDARRDGMTVVLRDHFGQFVPLDLDFSHREGVLLEHYQQALTALAQHH